MTDRESLHIDSTQAATWLGRLRAVVFFLWIVKISAGNLSTLAWLPVSILEPPLLLEAVPLWAWEWLLRPATLVGLQALLLLASAAAAVGLRPYQPIAVTAALLLTFEQGLVRSYGYSNHPELFMLLATWIIACAPAADRFSWSPRATLRPAQVYVAVIAFVAIVGCWTYTAAAVYRLAHHGLEMFVGASMKYSIVQNSFRYGSGAVGIFVLEHHGLSNWIQLALPVATLLELAAPLALLSRAFRWVWVAYLVVFHLLAAAGMAVLFWESMLTLGAALIVFDRVTRSVE